MTEIALAISPCPNDTFVFDAWIHKKIHSSVYPKTHFADIQELHDRARSKEYDVIKLSTYAFAKVSDFYKILPVGAAIAPFAPLLVAKRPFSIEELTYKSVCVPGLDTTAYLLMQLFLPMPKAVFVVRYDEIVAGVQSGIYDAGLIIHETRFTFQDEGLFEVCDLGAWFGPLIPLGVIAIKRSCSDTLAKEVISSIKRSIAYAEHDPRSSLSFVQKMSQEKKESVLYAHITAFVNDETKQLSKEGIRALQKLFSLAYQKNLIPRHFDETTCICNL